MKVVDYEAIKWGIFSGSAEIVRWSKSCIHPIEIAISFEYKAEEEYMCHMHHTPLTNDPQKISKALIKYGESLMIYWCKCWDCGVIIHENELKYDWRR